MSVREPPGPVPKVRILVCRGPECGARRGSAALHAEFTEALRAAGVVAELGWQSCFGRCSQGPNVLVAHLDPTVGPPRAFSGWGGTPGRATLYSHVDVTRVGELVRALGTSAPPASNSGEGNNGA